MDDAGFYAEIEHLDQELQAVPIELRQLDIYHALIGREERDQAALDALRKISAWFQQKYGARATWDGVLGRQPLIIRGDLQVISIRHPAIDERDSASELRQAFERAGTPLSAEEHKALSISYLESSSDFSAIHNLEMRPSLLAHEQREMARRAWFDLRNAVALLEASADIQGSIVAAHEAAEKFLKIGLMHVGLPYAKLGRGNLRHGLSEIVKELWDWQLKYRYLKRPARELQEIFGSMTRQRYQKVSRSSSDAVAAFRNARHCCGFVAMQIELDHLRGAPDVDLKVGRYYQDYSGRQYRYCGAQRGKRGELLRLMYLLEMTDRKQTVDVLCSFLEPCSFHYRQIDDKPTISRLERRYSDLQRRKHGQNRADGGIEVEAINESFDAMVAVRIPIRKGPRTGSRQDGL